MYFNLQNFSSPTYTGCHIIVEIIRKSFEALAHAQNNCDIKLGSAKLACYTTVEKMPILVPTTMGTDTRKIKRGMKLSMNLISTPSVENRVQAYLIYGPNLVKIDIKQYGTGTVPYRTYFF